MMLIQNAKIRKSVNYLLRALIILVTYYFVYRQVFIHHQFREFTDIFDRVLQPGNAYRLAALLLAMMLVNWGLETIKWKILIARVEKVPFFRAFMAVMSGVSVSMFMPNRTGDYLGRVFILRKGNPVEGIFATIVGSFAQIIVTFGVGLFCLLSFVDHYLREPYRIGEYVFSSLIFLVPCLVFVIILAYFRIGILSDLLNKYLPGKWERVKKFTGVFAGYSASQLGTVLLLSFLRYMVFTTQFYLLLRIFGASVPIAEGFILIPVVYLILALIPSIALAELGIRGSVAIFVIGMYFEKIGRAGTETELIILAAASVLWLINLVLPAVMGTFFVFSLKFFRK